MIVYIVRDNGSWYSRSTTLTHTNHNLFIIDIIRKYDLFYVLTFHPLWVSFSRAHHMFVHICAQGAHCGRSPPLCQSGQSQSFCTNTLNIHVYALFGVYMAICVAEDSANTMPAAACRFVSGPRLHAKRQSGSCISFSPTPSPSPFVLYHLWSQNPQCCVYNRPRISSNSQATCYIAVFQAGWRANERR